MGRSANQKNRTSQYYNPTFQSTLFKENVKSGFVTSNQMFYPRNQTTEYSSARALSRPKDLTKSVHGLSSSVTSRQARFTQASEENMFASANLTNYLPNAALAKKRVQKHALKNYGLGLAPELPTQQVNGENLQESILVINHQVDSEAVEVEPEVSVRVNQEAPVVQLNGVELGSDAKLNRLAQEFAVVELEDQVVSVDEWQSAAKRQWRADLDQQVQEKNKLRFELEELDRQGDNKPNVLSIGNYHPDHRLDLKANLERQMCEKLRVSQDLESQNLASEKIAVELSQLRLVKDNSDKEKQESDLKQRLNAESHKLYAEKRVRLDERRQREKNEDIDYMRSIVDQNTQNIKKEQSELNLARDAYSSLLSTQVVARKTRETTLESENLAVESAR
jgi:hypothetical protein